MSIYLSLCPFIFQARVGRPPTRRGLIRVELDEGRNGEGRNEDEDDAEQTESELDDEDASTIAAAEEENHRRSIAAAQMLALAGSDNASPLPDQQQQPRPNVRMAANLNIGNSSTSALRKVIQGRMSAGENESMDTTDPQGPIYDDIPVSKAVSMASTNL